MKNKDNPDGTGRSWNSDDLVIDKMSCNQLARLCTSYLSSLRMARQDFKSDGAEGVMKLIITIFQQQLALLNSDKLTEDERSAVEKNGLVTLQAVCMAGMFAPEGADPRVLTAIGIATLDVVHGLAMKVGPVGPDDAIIVDISRGDSTSMDGSNIQMAVRLEPISESIAAVDNKIGHEIIKIVKDSVKEPNKKPEPGVDFGGNN